MFPTIRRHIMVSETIHNPNRTLASLAVYPAGSSDPSKARCAARISAQMTIGPLRARCNTRPAKPDIVTANNGSNSLSVALGNGKGSFSPPRSVSLAFQPSLVVAGDFNKDGNTDLIVLSLSGPGVLNVLLGNGTGGFQPAVFIPNSPFGIAAIVVGDFNNDNKLDIAVA